MVKFMMMGCLTLVLVGAGGGYLGWRWWQSEGKQKAAAEVTRAMDASIDATGLPADDKKRLRDRINRTVDDFKSGKISMADLGKLAQELADSPVLVAASAQGALMDQLKEGSATLQSPQKRAEAERVLQRFVRAIMEHKVDEKRVTEITAALRERTPEGNLRIKEKLSPADVESVVTGMKKAADDAKVPDEKFQVDYVGEVTRIMDRVLDKKNAG